MRRLGLVLALVALSLVLGQRQSHAEVVIIRGYCFLQPSMTLISCPGSPTATRVPIVPQKTVTVSGPLFSIAGITRYNVGIVSRVVCFPVDEPIDVYSIA